jgi:hypothetical protein
MKAKFFAESVTHTCYGTEEVKMCAVYSNTPEDNEFAKATPSGSLTMSISNEKAMGFLKPGKKYFLDFTEAAE